MEGDEIQRPSSPVGKNTLKQKCKRRSDGGVDNVIEEMNERSQSLQRLVDEDEPVCTFLARSMKKCLKIYKGMDRILGFKTIL